MKKTIPETVVIVCDVCHKTEPSVSFVKSGGLHIYQHALDYQGSPCACGDMKFDVCDICLPKLIVAINARARTIRDHGE